MVTEVKLDLNTVVEVAADFVKPAVVKGAVDMVLTFERVGEAAKGPRPGRRAVSDNHAAFCRFA